MTSGAEPRSAWRRRADVERGAWLLPSIQVIKDGRTSTPGDGSVQRVELLRVADRGGPVAQVVVASPNSSSCSTLLPISRGDNAR